jgi:hypothetical protein
MKTIALYAGLLIAVSLGVATAPANAQATRTWVSGVGDDANPCTRNAPCKTFVGAINKTAAGGEINCLDGGAFGALTITKSIMIVCGQSGVGGVTAASGNNGINVATLPLGGRVVLDGLDLEGLAAASVTVAGLTGVNVIGQATVIIRNCSIRNFAQNGVNVAATSGTTRVVIQNSIITGNGVSSNSTTPYGGVNVVGAAGIVNNVEIVNSQIDSNTGYNLQVDGTSGTVNAVLAGSILTGTAPNNIIVKGGGNVISYGNNVLRNNGSPTQTLMLQ